MTPSPHINNKIEFQKISDDTALLTLKGHWRATEGFQNFEDIEKIVTADDKLKIIKLQTKNLEDWDTSLLAFLIKCDNLCRRRKITFDINDLPPNLQQLLLLSKRKFEHETIELPKEPPPLTSLGQSVVDFFKGCKDVFSFLGELTLSIGRIVIGKSQTRWRDFIVFVQEVGAEALPIVTLISFLVGFIMAFIGFTQLRRFGATIYVADLVGIGMVREMGVMMTGIIMCGRTGAAFAATLGSMKIGEEIDALKTTGISPFDFLVTPRVLAMLVMMPLLTIYADFIGVFGGLFVTSGFSEITLTEYWQETQITITMKHISVGMYKSIVFGILIALTGCLRGLQCGSNASAVGDATTSAVVTGITSLVIADAIFAVLFDALNI